MKTSEQIIAEIDSRIEIFAFQAGVKYTEKLYVMQCSCAAFSLAKLKQFILEQPDTMPVLPPSLDPKNQV